MTVGVGLLGVMVAAGMAQGTDAGTSSSSQAVTGQATAPGTAPLSVKLGAAAPVTYLNKYEIYGGINLQNFQGGQNIPKRMNLGGVELAGTYWATRHLGAVAEFRGEAGTGPVFPNPYTTRPLVVLYTFMGGVQYRGPRNQRFALNYHAYAGGSYGDFTETPLPAGYSVGLYNNHTAPMGVAGGSLDYNRSKNVALRISPDMVFEHFGTETREFFAISGGIVYRIGKK